MPRSTPLLLLALAAGCSAAPGSSEAPDVDSRAGDQGASVLRGMVQHVVDGDTIRVRTPSGETERVRLLGIDAPELSETRTGSAQCGGAEASAELARAVRRGTEVELTTDPSQDRRDRFGRLLAYVAIRGEATTMQERLLRDGWARVYVFDRDRPFGRVERFREAAAQARRERAGVWDVCGGDFRRPVR